MNTFTILNTASDASCSIFENNCRLKNNYAGPFSGGGFLISTNPGVNSARVSGMYISNTSIDSYAPTYVFKCFENSFILFPSGNNCLILSGSIPYVFSQNSLIINSPTGHPSANVSGVQVFATTNPSLNLTSTSQNTQQAIRFINNNGVIPYCIVNSNSDGIIHCANPAITFNNYFRQSGNGAYLVNFANPNSTDVQLLVSGKIRSVENYSSTGYICGKLNVQALQGESSLKTGLDVFTTSRFNENIESLCNLKNSGIVSSPCFSGGNACLNTAIYSSTGFFSDSINSNCGIFNNICAISGTSYFSGIEISGLTAKGSILIPCLSVLNSFNYTGDINFSNRISTSGIYKFASSGIEISATGTNNNIILSGNLSCINNINSSGNLYANSICSTGLNIKNYFNNDIGINGQITGFSLLSGNNSSALCVSCACVLTSITANSLSILNSLTYNGDITTTCSGCFAGLNVGTNSSGEIGAINSSKAWGVFALSGGIPLGATGYNFSDVRVAGTGMFKTAAYTAYNTVANFTCNSATVCPGMSGFYYFFYGLRLNKPIRYPFAFSSTFMNTSIPVGTAPTGLVLQTLTLATTNLRYSGLYGSGTVANPVDNLMSRINLVNCGGFNTAGNFCFNDFEKFVVGKCYNEIVVNISPFDLVTCTGGYRYNANTSLQGFLNGTGMFHII
jgi:hypothetical protein